MGAPEVAIFPSGVYFWKYAGKIATSGAQGSFSYNSRYVEALRVNRLQPLRAAVKNKNGSASFVRTLYKHYRMENSLKVGEKVVFNADKRIALVVKIVRTNADYYTFTYFNTVTQKFEDVELPPSAVSPSV